MAHNVNGESIESVSFLSDGETFHFILVCACDIFILYLFLLPA